MILVAGGTGFVGQNIVRELLARGYPVRVLARHPVAAIPPGPGSGRHAEYVLGDALKPESLPAAMVGVAAVINLIGIIAETPWISFKQAHIEATTNLLAAAKHARVTRWLQMSAIGTRFLARSDYHATKWEAEERVRASGLDWTILRPSLIYGHGAEDRLINLMRRAMTFPLSPFLLDSFPVLDGGRGRVQPVNVREVAHAFSAALGSAESIGKVYDLVGPRPLTWRELVSTVAEAVGRRPLYEEYPLLVALRGGVWLTAALLLVTALYYLFRRHENLLVAEAMALAGAVLAILALRMRRLIIYNFPSGPVWLATVTADHCAPSWLRIGNQFRMLQEDNVGDPGPATRDFGYVPETFAEGVERIVGRSHPSS